MKPPSSNENTSKVPDGFPEGTVCKPVVMTKTVNGVAVTFINKKGKLWCKKPGSNQFHMYIPPIGPSPVLNPGTEDDPDDELDDELLTKPPTIPTVPPELSPFDNPVRTEYTAGVFGEYKFGFSVGDPFSPETVALHDSFPQVVWRSSGPFPNNKVMSINKAELHTYDITSGPSNARTCYFMCICTSNFANEIMYVRVISKSPNASGREVRFSAQNSISTILNSVTLEPIVNPIVTVGNSIAFRPYREGINYFKCNFWQFPYTGTPDVNPMIFELKFDAFYDSRCKFVNKGAGIMNLEPAPSGKTFTPYNVSVTGGVQTIITEDAPNTKFSETNFRVTAIADSSIRTPPMIIVKSLLYFDKYPRDDSANLSAEIRYADDKSENAFSPKILTAIEDVPGTEYLFYMRHTGGTEFEIGGEVVNELIEN